MAKEPPFSAVAVDGINGAVISEGAVFSACADVVAVVSAGAAEGRPPPTFVASREESPPEKTRGPSPFCRRGWGTTSGPILRVVVSMSPEKTRDPRPSPRRRVASPQHPVRNDYEEEGDNDGE